VWSSKEFFWFNCNKFIKGYSDCKHLSKFIYFHTRNKTGNTQFALYDFFYDFYLVKPKKLLWRPHLWKCYLTLDLPVEISFYLVKNWPLFTLWIQKDQNIFGTTTSYRLFHKKTTKDMAACLTNIELVRKSLVVFVSTDTILMVWSKILLWNQDHDIWCW
jgi:hypothetical protein